MPSQQQETLDMISNLKKALRREKEPPSTEPIYGTSNRGNKLKKGANHVHLGTLANTNGPEPYKQRIEHAGYTRYILERKGLRYNDYGDELSDCDSEDDPETYAAEADPYAGIRLEELLRPLTHPSELATHPTLSLPYLDPALPEMVKTAEEKLRQERSNLWRAKALNRQLLGDEAWMPLSIVENSDDWDLFEPRPASTEHANKRRKLNGEMGDVGQPSTEESGDTTGIEEDAVALSDGEHVSVEETRDALNGVQGDAAASDGEHATIEETGDATNGEDAMAPSSEGGSPAPPPRRITRALAAGNNSAGASSLSPSPSLTLSDSSLLQIDSIFLLPPAIHASNRLSALYGLPADEAIETRKLLTAYIQKQEECVRGLETVAAKLVSALKLRKDVWDMCKAEGHVGELSDGEDWIDAEAWGLKEGELRKGRFEEEDIQEEREAIGGGRKGKRRRREQN